jgi:hypothetical protein
LKLKFEVMLRARPSSSRKLSKGRAPKLQQLLEIPTTIWVLQLLEAACQVMLNRMSGLHRYVPLVGHRVPVELANDPPFRFLVEAYQGRSGTAIRNDQKSSSWKPRQQFLDLVREKVPRSDILSLVATIEAAVLHYDKIADIQGADYIFLEDLLRFLREFDIIGEKTFVSADEEIKARISCKEGSFESYLFEWDRLTQKEAFEREAVKAAEGAERMHASKKKALERQATRRREEQQGQENVRGLPLGEELKEREPRIEDLQRLNAEERSLVHGLSTAGPEPVNWLALAGETFRNQLSNDYEKLAELEKQAEQKEDYHTPPGSPMHE